MHWTTTKAKYEKKNDEIVKERARIKKETVQVGGLNTKTGFVTFTHQREKEITQNLKFSADRGLWAVSVPPEPSDIRWADLKVRDEFKVLNAVIGYACVIGVYVGFMPICIFVTNLANSFKMGPFQPLWMAFAPTMGLLLFLSFLPTVLILVFHFFFSLKADAYAQHKLQIWYFWFQVFFVILVTAIGTSLLDFFCRHLQVTFYHLQDSCRSATLGDAFLHELPRATVLYACYEFYKVRCAVKVHRVQNNLGRRSSAPDVRAGRSRLLWHWLPKRALYNQHADWYCL